MPNIRQDGFAHEIPPQPLTIKFSPAEIEYLAALLARIEALERRVAELEQFNTPDGR